LARIGFVSERLLLGFGVDLVIHCVASELSARGHDVTVYASVAEGMRSGHWQRPPLNGMKPAVNGAAPVSGDVFDRRYRVDLIPTPARGVFPLYDRNARRWADYLDAARQDVLFIETFPFFSLIPRLKTDTVVVDHGVSPSDGMSLFKRLNVAYMRMSQQRSYFPHAAAVLTVSEFIRSLLPEQMASRASVVYNGVDHYTPKATGDSSKRDEMRSRLGVSDAERLLLYVGRLNPEDQPYKGTADLVRAAVGWRAAKTPVRLVMAGKGSEADAGMIREAGGIALLDVPPGDMLALYSAADVYVTASRWEGFDLPLMEAAFHGVPCVALGVGAHPELVRNGETGLLAENVEQLVRSVTDLSRDPSRIEAIGAGARQHAAGFTWARTTDAYEKVLGDVSAAGASASAARSPTADVAQEPGSQVARDTTAIVLNYGAPFDILKKCIASIAKQTVPVEILLIDNASPRNLEALGDVERQFPDVRVLRLDKNYGFAGGMNRGVTAASTEFVLLLNNDVVLEPGVVAEMHKVMALDKDIIGVAPKILFESSRNVIDAMGNLIDPAGMAYNMGIGQLDIGQYDRIERTFGACFAATLLRRNAFDEGMVGPLDERYFMYYEDVDWCYRAGILGFKFLTAPAATVYHVHSLSTRELAYSFKYHLIMRNLLFTLMRNAARYRRPWLRVALGLTRNVIRGPFRLASLRAVVEATILLPVYMRARRRVQSRRRTPDQELFDLSHGERPHFDPTSYSPIRRLEVLEAMYRRLALISGQDRHRRIADNVSAISATRLRFDREFALQSLRPLVAEEPEFVREFVEALEF